MRDDEFNSYNITNERESFSDFEFGHTQNNESTSYKDNKTNIRDEINDNRTFNSDKKRDSEKRRKKEDELREKFKDVDNSASNNGSSGSSASSSGAASSGGVVSATAASTASIAGVSIVAITTVSTLVGINVFIAARVKMNKLDITPISVTYELELSNKENDDFIITLEGKNNNYYSYKELEEGFNEGVFEELEPSTTYNISVLDVSSDNFAIYKNTVITPKEVGPEPEPPTPGPEPTPEPSGSSEPGPSSEPSSSSQPGPSSEPSSSSEPEPTPTPSESITLSFDANDRDGTMSSIELEAGSEYSLPVCIFVPFDDECFSGWKVNGEGEMLQPGETITVNSDTTLVAGWGPISTEDKEMIAGKDIFESFPDQPSTETSTIMIGGVEYRYNNISYSSDNETLDMYLYDGFLSTTTPFAGPIKSITVNSKSVNYDLTIVYSDSPINERVTEGGETQTVEFAQDYTFECTNPDARYFCLSRDNKSNLASFEYIKIVYEAPIEYEYTVYFDANGGTGSCDPYVVRNTNKEIIPTIQRSGNIAPQDGYKFSGWKIKGVDDLLTPGTEFGISSDVTLVAQWEPTDLLTVRLDANGGSFDPIYPKQVQKNEIVMLPGEDELTGLVPPEEGYVFDGWSETPDGSSPVSYEYEVTKNVTLYVRWQQTGSYSLGNYLYLLTGDNTAHQVNIQPLGTYMYIKSMKYINDGTTTESRFNVSDGGFLTNYSENQGEIISVTVILSKAIKISVSFSENTMYQWNYDETNAHEYTCLNGDESYEFFPSSSAGACTYYNISAEEGSDYTVVKDIIVKYKIS